MSALLIKVEDQSDNPLIRELADVMMGLVDVELDFQAADREREQVCLCHR